MFLKIASNIPFLQCLVSFPFDTHVSALKKFFVLWMLTSLPIVVAAFLSPVTGENVLTDWFSRLGESISVSEQFVYTASFLTPVLYIWYEKYQGGGNEGFNQKLSQSIKEMFTGYGWVIVSAVLLMFLTAAAFSALKTNSDFFKSTYLYLFLTTYSKYVYFFALYCWYLSLLDGMYRGDYVAATRKSEKVVSKGLAERLKSRGEQDGR